MFETLLSLSWAVYGVLGARNPWHPLILVYFVFWVYSSDRSSPNLHEMGHFIIPSMCDPVHLQNFLQSNAQEARRRLQRKEQLVQIELLKGFNHHSNDSFENTPRIFFPHSLKISSRILFSKMFFSLRD